MRPQHGSRHVHLPEGLAHACGVLLTQVDVDEKTNENPFVLRGLGQIPDLTGVLITAFPAPPSHAQAAGSNGHQLNTLEPGEPCPQSLADLLRPPPYGEVVLDEVPQLRVTDDLAGVRETGRTSVHSRQHFVVRCRGPVAREREQ